MSLNNNGLIGFLLDMSFRQITEHQLFSKELLTSIHSNLGIGKAAIICFDTDNNFLSWTDAAGTKTAGEEHPYRSFAETDVVGHYVYDKSRRERLTYFNIEPKLYKSTDIIAPVDYEGSSFVRFLEENFGAHYSVTLAFGINAYIQLFIYKTAEEGDFTEAQMDDLRELYRYIAGTYRNFKIHEQTKIVSGLKDLVIEEKGTSFFIADAFEHILAHNAAADKVLGEIFGDEAIDGMAEGRECEWLSFVIKNYNGRDPQDSVRTIKDATFHVHVFQQKYSHGIVDVYYWVTLEQQKNEPDNANFLNNMLTISERKVAGYLLRGMTYKEIAQELVVSYHTVKNHVQNIYSKCGISNRYQLNELIKKSEE